MKCRSFPEPTLTPCGDCRDCKQRQYVKNHNARRKAKAQAEREDRNLPEAPVLTGTQFDALTIDQALLLYHVYGQNKASALMGGNPSPATIKRWATENFQARYWEIVTEKGEQLKDISAGRAEEFIHRAFDVEQDLLEEVQRVVGENNSKAASELSGALRNISTSKALNQDKIANTLRGRATTIIEHKSVPVALERLKELGLLVEGTVED